MNIIDILEAMGLESIINWEEADKYDLENKTVEVHIQPNYPLKAHVVAANDLDGVLTMALGAATEYGDEDAWG